MELLLPLKVAESVWPATFDGTIMTSLSAKDDSAVYKLVLGSFDAS